MGDCGAFSYVRENAPPFTVQEVIDFYSQCGFDYGLSVDHVILGFQPELDQSLPGLDVVPEEWRERQKITLELAEEFLSTLRGRRRAASRRSGSPRGGAPARTRLPSRELQKTRLPLHRPGRHGPAQDGGDPRLPEEGREPFGSRRRSSTCSASRGSSRSRSSADLGVVSFDSTSPLRQAFKDDKDNYYTLERTYCAVRVPQVEGNAKLRSRIVAGAGRPGRGRRLERRLPGQPWRRFDRGECDVGEVVEALRDYEQIHDGRSDRSTVYAEILRDRPWKDCPCEICRRLGIHVMLFRGAERNRRRGFHNLFVFYRRLRRESSKPARARRGRMNLTDEHSTRETAAGNGCGPEEIRLPALEVGQGPRRTLYSFAVDGKMLSRFTTVSRVRRQERRPRSRATSGRRSSRTSPRSATTSSPSDPMIPNAVVVAFDAGPVRAARRACRHSGTRGSARSSSPIDPVARRGGAAGLDRRRPAAHRRDPRGAASSSFPDLRRRLHHRRRPGAAGAVHPRELDEAAPQRAHLRTAADDPGETPLAPAAAAGSRRYSSTG